MASAKKPSKAKSSGSGKTSLFDYNPQMMSWVSKALTQKKPEGGPYGRIIYVGQKAKFAEVLRELAASVKKWEIDTATLLEGNPVSLLSSEDGPVWLVAPYRLPLAARKTHGGLIDASPYARARDFVGSVMFSADKYKLKALQVSFRGASDIEKQGALVGLELASYRYKMVRQFGGGPLPLLSVDEVDKTTIAAAATIGVATNLARHLVNVPPGDLNPTTFSQEVAGFFSKEPTLAVDVWDHTKLKKENMNLILAVGQGAKDKPCLVHIAYRPKAAGKSQNKPIALVGKGITFDTGGLDMKNAAGMRFMKKDMGGSAALVGLAYWLAASGCKTPCDIYLALAENAVSAEAFHPSDVLTARNGQTVEIHNTDAEGRLVLADALHYATTRTGKDEPCVVINLATLTGAIKVALGTDLYGLFSNDDDLAAELQRVSMDYGDRGWRMPLFSEYEPLLNSMVADVANASSSQFAGALTAALFLQRFVNGKPWAHLDIYAWTDMPRGGYAEVGANGQGVQCLIGYMLGGFA